jgi:hypothetical protein
MTTKLTVSIDPRVVERAKRYARSRSKSLSRVIQQYLEFITEQETPPTEVTSRVASLADRLVTTSSDDELKHAYLKEKYLDASDPR